jgi:toxin ParE1/3/4
MSTRLEVTPEADADIDDATLWYFEEDPDLAIRFSIELERVFDQILDNPRAWAEIEPDIRKALLRKFPYTVIYRLRSDCVQVVTVTHQHRAPGHWRSRG